MVGREEGKAIDQIQSAIAETTETEAEAPLIINKREREQSTDRERAGTVLTGIHTVDRCKVIETRDDDGDDGDVTTATAIAKNNE